MAYNIVVGVLIHLFVPLLVVGSFRLLSRRMSQAQIPSPPHFGWALLFIIFGAWLLVFLTAAFWQWSGMASLGVFALVLIAPLLTAALAFKMRKQKGFSRFHQLAYAAAIGYTGLIFILVLIWSGSRIFARE
ncbi:MAG TPA: hypothetical protein VFW05_03430 [Verrucomicrobiae bacterium]|nr:hypothetical protein [Verrucomicrobiae bacterium]